MSRYTSVVGPKLEVFCGQRLFCVVSVLFGLMSV